MSGRPAPLLRRSARRPPPFSLPARPRITLHLSRTAGSSLLCCRHRLRPPARPRPVTCTPALSFSPTPAPAGQGRGGSASDRAGPAGAISSPPPLVHLPRLTPPPPGLHRRLDLPTARRGAALQCGACAAAGAGTGSVLLPDAALRCRQSEPYLSGPAFAAAAGTATAPGRQSEPYLPGPAFAAAAGTATAPGRQSEPYLPGPALGAWGGPASGPSADGCPNGRVRLYRRPTRAGYHVQEQ